MLFCPWNMFYTATLQCMEFFWAFVTVHQECKVKRETNKKQLIWSLFQLSISTCFGHHYAHLQNKAMYYCIWCSVLVVFAVVVWSCDANCVHCVKVVVRLNNNFHTVHTARVTAPHYHSQHNQCRTPYAVIHGLVLLKMGIMMPETCWDRQLK